MPILDGHLETVVYDYPDWQSGLLTYGQIGVTANGHEARFSDIRVKSYDPALPK